MRSIYEDLASLMRLLGTAALSLALIGSLVVGQAAWSEEAETEDEEDAYTEDIYLMEEAIVVGSRHAPRSEKESAAPVDVLNADELRTQAAVDMDDMLRTLAPSYNIQRHGIDDEATLVRPATLRGLPPDNLLVLVNGKRRHRSGVIALLGSSLNTGSQGPDLSVIPAIALRQMELLRDGAAAQYGSDAIAGVLNLRLREASEGVLVETRGGQYFEGDGSLYQVAANAGLPLTEDAFLTSASSTARTILPSAAANAPMRRRCESGDIPSRSQRRFGAARTLTACGTLSSTVELISAMGLKPIALAAGPSAAPKAAFSSALRGLPRRAAAYFASAISGP